MPHSLSRRAWRAIPLLSSFILMLVTLILPDSRVQAITPPSLLGTAQLTAPFYDVLSNGSGSLAQSARLSWVRYGDVKWAEAEPNQEPANLTTVNFNFGALEYHRLKVQTLITNGFTPIVVVQNAPWWARETGAPWSSSLDCSRIKSDPQDKYMKRFGLFMKSLIADWRAKGTVVKYWVIWNEEDYVPPGAGPTTGTGCWGDANSTWYGGQYYAKALSYVYTKIREAYSTNDILVVSGGLGLDCPPTKCALGKFFQGMLNYNAGAPSWPYFDVVDIHSYTWWNGAHQDWDQLNANWAPEGTVLGKLKFIRDQLQAYNLSKPIMINEVALLCGGCANAGPYFKDDQANYLVRLYVRGMANAQHTNGNLIAINWWPFNYCGSGADQRQLIDACDTNNNGVGEAAELMPRPAYNALHFLGDQLSGAVYQGSLTSGAVEGYRFYKPAWGQEVRVYWRNTDCTSNCTIPTPAGTDAVMVYGPVLTGTGGYSYTTIGSTISIGFTPVFVFI